MYSKRNWKPSQSDLAKFEKEKETFITEISQIATESNVRLNINLKANSIYFAINGINYRISTHRQPEHDFNGVEFITRGRKDMIKIFKKCIKKEA